MKGTKTITASKPVVVRAYKNVPFATICATDGADWMNGFCQNQTIVFGGRVHSYVSGLSLTKNYPQFGTDVRFTDTSCDSLKLFFYGNDDAQRSGNTAHIQIVQERSDPVESAAEPGTVGTITVRLDGSTWYLNGAAAVDYQWGRTLIDQSSSAHCYTQSGTR